MRRRLPELLVLALLATAGALVFLDDLDSSGPSEPPAAQQAGAATTRTGPEPDPDDPHTWQTSDQVPGEIAPPLVPGERAMVSRHMRFTYAPAPGVAITGWDARTRRGPVRYYVMRVKWRTPGISIDLAHGRRTRHVQPVTDMIDGTRGIVAGTNGDFYDISDTGAPLGIGRARGGLLLNGIDEGWNNAISVDTAGRWHVGTLPMFARVVDHPEIEVTNYNSARVKIGGTGVYNRRFGRSAGYGWTDGQRRQVRLVEIRAGRVVRNTTDLPNGTRIRGTYLIARGDKAEDRLQALTVGTVVDVRRRVGDVQMALTGNAVLLKRRQLVVSDDSEMHPRTAVGVDRDTKELIVLVVDGRQEFSRGFTMVELGKMMRRLGAEDALNLDGGGSTTLAARRRGALRVLNFPSDGFLRSVPNGLEVTYRP